MRASVTERLAARAARRPWRTLAVWLLAVVAAVAAIGAFLGDGLTTDAELTSEPESVRALDLLAQHPLPAEGFSSELIVVRSAAHTVDDAAFVRRLDELRRIGGATGSIATAQDPLQNPELVSPDRHAVLIPLALREPGEDTVQPLLEVVREADGKRGFDVAMTGEFTTDNDFTEVSQRDLEEGELQFGLPAALIILVLVFGALVAAALPLVLALVSIMVALGLTALVSVQWELSIFAVNMLTGMGLALGIDYALFVVSRFREERAAGKDRAAAIGATGATASRAVLFSGTAFVLAMLGLLLVQNTIMRSLAAGAILVGVVSVVGALTLLPALLSRVGGKVDSLRLPLVARGAAGESRFWRAIVDRVLRRPALSLAAASALLLVAAAPTLTMNIGAAGISTLPDDLSSKQGFLALERFFPAAGADPVEIVAPNTPAAVEGTRQLRVLLAGDSRFGPVAVTESSDGELLVVRVGVAADALSERAIDAVRRLRAEYVPGSFGSAGVEALVAGETAENIDYFDVMEFWLPIVIAFVLGLSFVLLTVAFRSIVVAGTAIVLNLLSVGAAYGLVVAVFQHGWGNGLLGFTKVDSVEAWVPLFLFAVLFGLSMDYQVFLLTRIRERYARTRDTSDAVSFGIASTARIITGAALIIVAVFVGFARGDLVMFQQMGFGVAVALLIDATIVRSVLVPAAMALLGERNWYLPTWLEWLPHVEVEGHSDVRPAATPPA